MTKNIRLLSDKRVDVNDILIIDSKYYRIIGLTYQSKGILLRINPIKACKCLYTELKEGEYEQVFKHRRFKKQ